MWTLAATTVGKSGGDIGLLVGIALALVASAIALAGLCTTRAANARRTVGELVDRLDQIRLDLVMWRMDMLTRRGSDFWSLEPRTIDNLVQMVQAQPERLTLLTQTLSEDWGSPTAHMIDVYNFALRVHVWLAPEQSPLAAVRTSGMRKSTKTRLLNDTFGYRLCAMFLDHQLVACRLRSEGNPAAYYATHYGVFDKRYAALVTNLFNDLTTGPHMGANLWVLPKKYEALCNYLDANKPIDPPTRDNAS